MGVSTHPEPPFASSGCPVDRAIFNELRELFGADFPELIADYLRSTPDLVTGIREGTEHRDAERVKTAAHQLKATSGSVGAENLARLAGIAEDHARLGETDECSQIARVCETEFRRVARFLTSQP